MTKYTDTLMPKVEKLYMAETHYAKKARLLRLVRGHAFRLLFLRKLRISQRAWVGCRGTWVETLSRP